ncbi:dolichol-phosphate mannosyltransferase [Thermococcus kodakarensis KOD1]|uniref:Dolichol-phosphate mannosyltransferase n=1 Tax=Thermococcus kodakarensis (strain ATCC BAA-918 / JCM 12380 / KOD1) TaxID=69014 RepID=Q5JCY5_THEKO|nr:glycosyltransferase family 2 protein [Thermococcus kodakarensis]WCN29168.1 glycosyltransferase family 2 protein [Thermococcus kodakarensis]WCN31473.1 glycosyltransferase family 2 protein [Thermococcus kodakarensis]BAD84553.1 dolichol-phosphate mannosyltransferase [Thermococcus kodakarensis KOD1]
MLGGMRISVVIPAYNEEKRLPKVLERIPEFVDEVIVVDDGSSDNTYSSALSFSEKDPRVKAFRLEKNCGKGCAMREGIKHTTGDIVVFMDADGQHLPEEIGKLVRPIVEGRADLVIGARKVEVQGKRPLHRRLSNIITTRLIRLKLGTYVYDTQSGFRAYRRGFLPEIESDRYEVETEMLIKAAKMGAKIVEVPVSMIYGVETGHFRAEDVFRFLLALLRG